MAKNKGQEEVEVSFEDLDDSKPVDGGAALSFLSMTLIVRFHLSRAALFCSLMLIMATIKLTRSSQASMAL